MKKFQVIADSTSDLIKADRDASGVDYVKMIFTQSGSEYEADLDWPKISFEDYYDAMRKGNRSVTGLVKTSEFETKFKEYLEQGMDILYISCSSKLSGSVNNGKLVASELLESYPGRKIVCYDSLRSCYAQGMMVLKAAKMAEEGKEIEDVVALFDEEKLNYQTYATVGSLEWLKKAGRVKASAAFFGNLFGVKPIILGDANGNNYAFKKVKGRKTSLDELIACITENIVNPETADVYVEHAACEKDAQYIVDGLKLKNIVNVHVSPLGPIIGATCGPDTITVSFYGKKVTIVGEE